MNEDEVLAVQEKPSPSLKCICGHSVVKHGSGHGTGECWMHDGECGCREFAPIAEPGSYKQARGVAPPRTVFGYRQVVLVLNGGLNLIIRHYHDDSASIIQHEDHGLGTQTTLTVEQAESLRWLFEKQRATT